MPKDFGEFTLGELSRLVPLSYQERLLRVLEKFPLGGLSPATLRQDILTAYCTSVSLWLTRTTLTICISFILPLSSLNSYFIATFSHKDVMPVTHLEDNHWLMETYHGMLSFISHPNRQITTYSHHVNSQLEAEIYFNPTSSSYRYLY